jgi:hypothetical protein
MADIFFLCFPNLKNTEATKKALLEQMETLQKKIDSQKSLLASTKNCRKQCERELGQSMQRLGRVQRSSFQAGDVDCFSCFFPSTPEKKMQMRLKQMKSEIAAAKFEKELLQREMEELVKVLDAEQSNAKEAKRVEHMPVNMPFGASKVFIRSKTPAEQTALKQKLQGLLEELKATSAETVGEATKKLQAEKKDRQATIAALEKRAEVRNDTAQKILSSCSESGWLANGRGQTPTVQRTLKTQIKEASQQLNAEVASYNKMAQKSFAFKQS